MSASQPRSPPRVPLKRPPALQYGVDDRPPLAVTVLSALQHAAVLICVMFTTLEICRQAGLPRAAVVNVLSVGLLMAGVGTVLQSRRLGPLGTGRLFPNGAQAVYLGPSVVAAHAGGMPLVFGMTIMAGLVEVLVSRLWRPLQPFLPPELSGVVVLLIGMQLASAGIRNLVPDGLSPPGASEATAALTLGTMIALNIWSRGVAKLLCVLLGVTVGYASAYGLDAIPRESIAAIEAMPLFALPHVYGTSVALHADAILPFAVVGFAGAMATGANITVIERLDDAGWVRPDLTIIGRATLTDGLVAALSGLAGTSGIGGITANVGVMVATGVTSRAIATAFGLVAVVLALFPRFSAVLATMPPPVVGGALLFSAAFTMTAGLQIMTSRLLDGRKSLMIGLSIAAALASYIYPALGVTLPRQLQPILGSALVAGTLVGLALTVLFRIGVRRRVAIELAPGSDFARTIEDFGLKNGAAWGARPEIVRRAIFALTQLVEAVMEHGDVQGPVRVEAAFDEFNLDAEVSYSGKGLEFPDVRPSNRDILETDQGARRLAGFMLRRTADRIASTFQDGQSRVRFHFDH